MKVRFSVMYKFKAPSERRRARLAVRLTSGVVFTYRHQGTHTRGESSSRSCKKILERKNFKREKKTDTTSRQPNSRAMCAVVLFNFFYLVICELR